MARSRQNKRYSPPTLNTYTTALNVALGVLILVAIVYLINKYYMKPSESEAPFGLDPEDRPIAEVDFSEIRPIELNAKPSSDEDFKKLYSEKGKCWREYVVLQDGIPTEHSTQQFSCPKFRKIDKEFKKCTSDLEDIDLGSVIEDIMKNSAEHLAEFKKLAPSLMASKEPEDAVTTVSSLTDILPNGEAMNIRKYIHKLKFGDKYRAADAAAHKTVKCFSSCPSCTIQSMPYHKAIDHKYMLTDSVAIMVIVFGSFMPPGSVPPGSVPPGSDSPVGGASVRSVDRRVSQAQNRVYSLIRMVNGR